MSRYLAIDGPDLVQFNESTGHWELFPDQPGLTDGPLATVGTAIYANQDGNIVVNDYQSNLRMRHYENGTWVWKSIAPYGSGARSLWGNSYNEIYLITDQDLFFFDGTSWSMLKEHATGAWPSFIQHVWASSPSDVWVAEGIGNLWHFNGSVWADLYAQMLSDTGLGVWEINYVNEVHGLSSGEVYIVSSGVSTQGRLVKYNGTTFIDLGATSWGSAIHVWAIDSSNVWVGATIGGGGSEGRLYYYNGSTITQVIGEAILTTGSGPGRIIGRSASDMMYAVQDGFSVSGKSFTWDGIVWTRIQGSGRDDNTRFHDVAIYAALGAPVVSDPNQYGVSKYGNPTPSLGPPVIDSTPPALVSFSPDDGAKDVPKGIGLCLSLGDDVLVDYTSITVLVNGYVVWENGSGIVGYSASFSRANLLNGFDLCIVRDSPWPSGEIAWEVTARDTAGNELAEGHNFNTQAGEENPFSMYRMMVQAIRTMDERSPGTLQKLLQGFQNEANGLDAIWERLLLDPQKDLPTLFDPIAIDAKWLPRLKSIVGFTRDLNFNTSEIELRRLIENAVLYWNAKPSTLAIERAIRMVTGNRFRLRDYFKLRFQADQTSVTEELADFDPNVLDFGQDIPIGTQGNFGMAGDTFFIADLPGTIGIYGFESSDQFLFVQVLAGPNAGTYPIRTLTQGGTLGTIDITKGAAFPDPADFGNQRAWRLVGEAAEFTQELRLVDEGFGELDLDQITTFPISGDTIIGVSSGAKARVHTVTAGTLGAANTATLVVRNLFGRFLQQERFVVNAGSDHGRIAAPMRGVVNVDLLLFLLEQIRPVSERIDVVLIDLIDQFHTKGDLDQWTLGHFSAGAPSVVVGEGTGYAEVAAQSTMFSGTPGDFQDDWRDQTTAWKVTAVTAGTRLRGYFMAQNTTLNDAFYWELDYATQELKLFKVVTGAATQIGATVALPFLFELQTDVVRVDALADSGTTRIRVRVDGELFIEETDNQWDAGHIGFAADVGTARLLLAEVNTIPTKIFRVGPR